MQQKILKFWIPAKLSTQMQAMRIGVHAEFLVSSNVPDISFSTLYITTDVQLVLMKLKSRYKVLAGIQNSDLLLQK